MQARSRLVRLCAVAVIMLAAPNLYGQNLYAQNRTEFELPPQSLAASLRAVGSQTSTNVLFDPLLVEGRNAPALKAELTTDLAFERLLAGTALEHRFLDDKTVVIAAAEKGSGSAAASGNAAGSSKEEGGPNSGNPAAMSTPRRTVQASMQWSTRTEEAQRSTKSEEQGLPIEEIVVTGSRIKGVKDQFSPVTQISREEMDLAGFKNVSDIFESLPQNFGGGTTIDDQSPGGAGQGGTSVNLRGLGNEATLILLNGRRLAPGGASGNFIDISSIPASAIDRVDVLTDGASAIYGSDAIAGVVNIILRDDFEGAETRLNVGTITDGGGDYLTAGQTLGWSGDRAHAMVTYEYSAEEELDADQKDFAENAIEPTWLLPETQKHSIFASTGVELSDRIKLSADGFFNDRRSKQSLSFETSQSVRFFQETSVQQYGGALGLNIAFTDDWEANLSGGYSKSDQLNEQITSTDGIPGGQENSPATEILSFEGSIGASLFSISDDPVKGVVGVHYRSEKADLFTVLTPSQTVSLDSDKSRNVFAAFGELYAPIISGGNRMPGVESLALTVAARYEEYKDVGSSLDPKVGLAWSPIKGLNLRGTYGTSFRAPRLDQLEDRVTIVLLGLLVDPNSPDGETVAVEVRGTTDELDPEQSRTWTVGFDFTPGLLDGLSLRGTYFNTVYSDRVGRPSLSFDPEVRFFDFTGIPRDVSPQTALEFCSRALQCFNIAEDFNPELGDISFDDVELLLDTRRQNISASSVAGFDFEGSYVLSSAIGDWRLLLGGTLLTKFEQQVAPVTLAEDLLNTFANPVDLKIRGSVQWRTEAMTTAFFVNHVGNYVDDEVTTGAVPVDSFTTMDATIRLDLGKLADNPLTEGTFLSFSAINLLNEDPPFINVTPVRFATFDAANADPAGRRIGIQLTKRW